MSSQSSQRPALLQSAPPSRWGRLTARVRRSPFLGYGLAVLFVALATLLTLAVRQSFTLNPTPLLVLALVAAAWYGGRRQGLLAALLIDLAVDFFFENPPYAFGPAAPHIMRLFVLAVIALLTSARRGAEDRLRRRGEQQAAVAQLGRRALTGASPAELQDEAVSVIGETLGVEYSAFCELRQEDDGLLFKSGAGWAEGVVGHAVVSAGRDSQAGYTLLSKEPVILRDAGSESRFALSPMLRDHGVRSGVSVLVPTGDRPVGVLGVFTRRRRKFTRDDVSFLQAMANVLAEAIERRRAEDEVGAQREWLRTTLASIGDAVIATDTSGRVTFMNPVAQALTGWAEAEAEGRPLAEVFNIVSEETRRGVESPVEKVLREGAVAGLANHTVLLARDGREVPIDDSGAPIRDERGRVVGVVMVFHDITERRRAEAALQNQRRWLQEVLNLAPTPVLLIEPGTARVTFANRAADELAGGRFVTDVRADEYHEAYVCTDEQGRRIPNEGMPGVRAARGERLEGFQMDWHTPGGVRSLLIFADTLPEMHGHPATAILVFQDITPLKRVEAELRQASRLKDEFLATVSHELRTPLTSILGWAAMLRRNQFDAGATARALETIERNARAQAQIVEDVLDVSRVITGKLRLDVRPVRLTSVVETAAETVRPTAEAKGVRIHTAGDPDVGLIQCDPSRLQQVLWNLLSNAVKFTDKGGSVSVRVRRDDSRVRIEVSDTGQGIEPKFLPYIFDRFSQSDGSTTRRHGGLGLGLAIVRHLVELHGGRVRAESAGAGRGATVTVELPVAAAPGDADGRKPREPQVLAGAGPPDCPPSLEGLRVLVVDDEPDARELLSAILTSCGAEARAAGSAAEALRLLEESRHDVLVSDIGMPEEDGYVLIRKVRALGPGRGGRVPAVALTAYAREEDRMKALLAGYHVHVAKPVNPEELIAVIASLAGLSARA